MNEPTAERKPTFGQAIQVDSSNLGSVQEIEIFPFFPDLS
jgi:hypothetical protein